MLNYIFNTLITLKINITIAEILSNIILLIFIIFISAVVKLVTDKIILKKLSLYVKKTKIKWDDIMLTRKVFNRLFHLITPLLIYFFIPSFSSKFQFFLNKIIFTYVTIIILSVIVALLNFLNDIYNNYAISKNKPIKGFIQVSQMALYIFGIIIISSNLLDKSPIIILSGIGALAAVFLIVFKDSLLGLVSGIQIATNDMVRIGDWIEMPKYDANGEVIDISLNIIKVENFDKTVTTIPSYAFISDSFKNWRNMQECGGRRIKRSIYIDSSSIQLCDSQMIEKFKNIRYISNYITNKQKEIQEYNKNPNIDPTQSINIKRLTNIGTFRIYIQLYLNNHPSIHKNMIQMVRQLEPRENGVPLEIYAFTNDTEWINYEGIQADIFDHILSVASEFNIRIFQNPSGYDIQSTLRRNT
ncbi:MAG: mechanosensitive ion channel family protein [Clostridia bacterium]|nr:mechanosensitive ion channel family protein [Clostridia bacterium]MDD4387448.1 mechanosensitive ion channel family protein [Clostridia bacterium]